MHRIFVAAILAAGVAVAVAQDAFLKGDDLAAEIAKSCADGCITFNHEEAENFKQQLDMLIGQKQKEAFAAGMAAQKAACRSLI
jgi:hypothetical protein